MLVSKLTLENTRSFLSKEELVLDGEMSIVVGPNGGGKTNLLDALSVVLRRYLFASMFANEQATPDGTSRYDFRHNDALNSMVLDKHQDASDQPQRITVEIEVTATDIANMEAMREDNEKLLQAASAVYTNLEGQFGAYRQWDPAVFQEGEKFTYTILDGVISYDEKPHAHQFLQYLQYFEPEAQLRNQFGFGSLTLPFLYLPVNRTSQQPSTRVDLANLNIGEAKRHADSATSKSNSNVISLAIAQLAMKHRLLQEQLDGNAFEEFHTDPQIKRLTRAFSELGYDWALKCINTQRNSYDVQLTKQGTSFFLTQASSGERELFTYLLAIFALNVRNALIIVDEPELHLHPKWQKSLLRIFKNLADESGNRFLLATHSPTFISPESIRYVSRVYSRDRRSHIARLTSSSLPESKHLLNIVNSQNNESIFFADTVILVEGISDRIFFEALLDKFGRTDTPGKVIEVISVGGKTVFAAYKKVLDAAFVPFSVIADRDYIEQVGTGALKALFSVNAKGVKEKVLEDATSRDADSLIRAIDLAISGGSWGDAAAIWEYIKSRHRRLLKDLNSVQMQTLLAFIESCRTEGLHILSRGALEDFLPKGYRAKDIEKLITLLAGDFWSALSDEVKPELEKIVRLVLAWPDAVANEAEV